jgi:hypothetical protein
MQASDIPLAKRLVDKNHCESLLFEKQIHSILHQISHKIARIDIELILPPWYSRQQRLRENCAFRMLDPVQSTVVEKAAAKVAQGRRLSCTKAAPTSTSPFDPVQSFIP